MQTSALTIQYFKLSQNEMFEAMNRVFNQTKLCMKARWLQS